ncbi:MAG: SDR family NAD(P)-dependent oxidoreductase [Acidimicrobiales bacterium]
MTSADPAVFVTGGSGVVGRAVIRHLVEAGRTVRALVRSEQAGATVQELGAQPVSGDVLDIGSLEAGLDGCDVAYHVAGMNQFCLKDPSPMYRVNVTGSTNVVRAVAGAGVRRLVYTSSAVTIGEPHEAVGREDSPHRGSFLSSYERSKFEAERLVLELADRHGVDVVSVNPSSVQGPGRVTGTGQVLVQYLRGRLKAWVDTPISLVDIDDCADGHLLAEAKGRSGERYVLNAASLDASDLMRIMAGIAPGVRTPRMVPRTLAVVAASVTAAAARATGRTPLVCRESLRTLLHGHRYDGSKAERELGLHYRPVDETLRRTATWLVDQGLVPADALAAGGNPEKLPQGDDELWKT